MGWAQAVCGRDDSTRIWRVDATSLELSGQFSFACCPIRVLMCMHRLPMSLICVGLLLRQEMFRRRRSTSVSCKRGGMYWCAPADLVQANIDAAANENMATLPQEQSQYMWIDGQPLGVKRRLAAYNRSRLNFGLGFGFWVLSLWFWVFDFGF